MCKRKEFINQDILDTPVDGSWLIGEVINKNGKGTPVGGSRVIGGMTNHEIQIFLSTAPLKNYRRLRRIPYPILTNVPSEERTTGSNDLIDEVASCWSKGDVFQLPAGVRAIKQKSSDHLRTLASANQLEEGATDDIDRACLLASSVKEPETWQHALSISALVLQIDDDSVRRAVLLSAHMGLAINRVKGDITAMLPSTSSLIVP